MQTLALSGWAQPHDALAAALDWREAHLLDYSDYPDVEAFFAALAPFAEVQRVVGWSLGGHLAARAIAAGLLRPRQLVLIAAPYRFVGEGGMDPLTYTQFRSNYVTDTERTTQRFHGLIAWGDREARRVLGALRHHPEVERVERWLPWLDQLGEDRMESLDFSGFPPTLLVHGAGDAIVPCVQSTRWAEKIPQTTLSVWEDAGHAPHLHDKMRLMTEIHTHSARLA